MNNETRRLAAIMFTDVVGYSRLMAQDERRALELLRELRGILPPLIEQSHGILHKEIGDGTFSSFASAVDATRCACSIQDALQRHPGIELRIGLHVGDVITEQGDIYGDGVNIAARIEPLAPPGGIALSDTVLAQIRGKLDLPLRSLGQPMLKNIGLAMEVFVWEPAAAEQPMPVAAAIPATADVSESGWWTRLRRSRLLQWTLAYIALAFGLLQGVVLLGDLFGAPGLVSRIAAVVLGWGIPAAVVVAWFHGTPGRQRLVRRELALLAGVATLAAITVAWQVARAPPGAAFEQPRAATVGEAAAKLAPTSVVVLPFENPAGRAEDAYLSEGFSDELRDQLSRVAGLRVIARDSSIAFRDAKPGARAIALELGVGTVIEGSLRKEGDQLRIAVRLIDGASGVQRWSESYDRASTSLLAVQQEIALAAARAIQPQLSAADIPKPQWQASVNDLMLLARSYQQSAIGPQDQDRVIDLYRQVLAQDPQSASAHARLGRALLLKGEAVAAEQHLRRALTIEPNLAEGYANMGFLLWSQFRKGAGAMFERALELNPNDADALHLYAQYVSLQRSDTRRDAYLARARELDPMSLLINADIGWAAATRGYTDQVNQALSLIARRFPDVSGRVALERIADTAGLLDESIAWGQEALQLDPGRRDVVNDLAERYARLGMPAESARVQPDSSLRVLFWMRRYPEIVERMAGEDLDEVDADALGDLAFALQALGRDAEAVPILQSMGLPEIVLDDDLRRWAALHHLATLIGSLQASGDNQEARRLALWLEQFAGRNPKKDPGWGGHYWSACATAVLGKQEQAIADFELTANAPNLAWLPRLRDSACFRSLQGDPRFEAALKSLEARHAQLREQLPATLARHGLGVQPASSETLRQADAQ